MDALLCVTHTADHRETVRRTVTSFPGLVIISLFHIVANTYRTTYQKTNKKIINSYLTIQSFIDTRTKRLVVGRVVN